MTTTQTKGSTPRLLSIKFTVPVSGQWRTTVNGIGQSLPMADVWGKTQLESKANAELIVRAVNSYAALKAVAEAATLMLNSIEGNATPYIIGKRRGQMRDALAALAAIEKEVI